MRSTSCVSRSLRPEATYFPPLSQSISTIHRSRDQRRDSGQRRVGNTPVDSLEPGRLAWKAGRTIRIHLDRTRRAVARSRASAERRPIPGRRQNARDRRAAAPRCVARSLRSSSAREVEQFFSACAWRAESRASCPTRAERHHQRLEKTCSRRSARPVLQRAFETSRSSPARSRKSARRAVGLVQHGWQRPAAASARKGYRRP